MGLMAFTTGVADVYRSCADLVATSAGGALAGNGPLRCSGYPNQQIVLQSTAQLSTLRDTHQEGTENREGTPKLTVRSQPGKQLCHRKCHKNEKSLQ